MEGAFAWISAIVDWLGKFFPRFPIVPKTHRAVKFVRGDKVVPLEPGVHVYWPLVTEFLRYPVTRQTLDLRPQKLTTADDRTVLIGAMISYEIDDITKALVDTYNVDSTIHDAALRVATRIILTLTWDELKSEARRRTLDTKLRNEAQRVLGDYGVNVIEMSLTDLAVTKVYSLAQSTNVI